ncbi:MAG: hypothetical protein GX184_05270 [Clostridiaceae bacterium]|nr:hypothetical protein [Clostridiaceae bacterium]
MMGKWLKKKGPVAFIVFMVIMVISMTSSKLELYADVYIPDEPHFVPQIRVYVDDDLELVAGKTGTFNLHIQNLSPNSYAKNIVFTPLYKEDSPFVSVKVLSEQPIKWLTTNGGEADIELMVEADKLVNDGYYPLTFQLSYTNTWNDAIAPTEHTVYIKIKSYQTNCNLKLTLPEGQTVSAKAGEMFELSLLLTNEGTLSAKGVKVSIKDLAQDTFMLFSGNSQYDFYRVFGSEKRSLNYKLIASEKLKSSSYPVTFEIEYTDELGKDAKVEQQIWIPVKGAGDAKEADLQITEIKPSLTSVKPGENFNVDVEIKNTDSMDSGQIKISAESTEALLPTSQNLIIIQNLKPGEDKKVTFSFQPDYNAARGGVPITIKVAPVGADESAAIARAISVFVDSDVAGGEAGKNVPKIIVKSYSSEPTLVDAGEEFKLNVQFANTHATKTVRNIKGSFIVTEESNETGSVFSPVGSSNTFYIDKIAPKGTYDWDLTLFTIPDAKSKTYTVTISFEYEDDAGNPYKADEIIGIPVYQPARFEVSDISLPPEIYVGNPVYVAFEMYNLGKTDIYNVKLNIEGDFHVDPKSSYFGNFTPGYREYFEVMITPNMPGETTGRIIFQYETASGEQKELVKELSMNVMEMMMPPGGEFPVDGPMDPGMDPSMGSRGFVGSVWFYIIIGVVVAGIAAAVVIIIKRKRKKSEEFEV